MDGDARSRRPRCPRTPRRGSARSWQPWMSTSPARSCRIHGTAVVHRPAGADGPRPAPFKAHARHSATRPGSSPSLPRAGPRSSQPRSRRPRAGLDAHGRTRGCASASSSRRSATCPAGSTSCRCTRGSRSTLPRMRRSSSCSARPTCGSRCCPRGTRRCSTSSMTSMPSTTPAARASRARCAGCATPSRAWRRCARSWRRYGIAETIQHDDLNDGAVYVRDGRYVILDWGDACVSCRSSRCPWRSRASSRGDSTTLGADTARSGTPPWHNCAGGRPTKGFAPPRRPTSAGPVAPSTATSRASTQDPRGRGSAVFIDGHP